MGSGWEPRWQVIVRGGWQGARPGCNWQLCLWFTPASIRFTTKDLISWILSCQDLVCPAAFISLSLTLCTNNLNQKLCLCYFSKNFRFLKHILFSLKDSYDWAQLFQRPLAWASSRACHRNVVHSGLRHCCRQTTTPAVSRFSIARCIWQGRFLTHQSKQNTDSIT